MDRYITIIVNPNQKIFVPRKNVFLIANEEGLIKLNVDDLLVTEKTVVGFEKELELLITEDQQYNLYDFIAKTSSITITALSLTIGVEREIAKQIIYLAMAHKILITGWNNTWKATDKTIKERMADRVRNRNAEAKRNIEQEPMHVGVKKYTEELDAMTKKHKEEHEPQKKQEPIKQSETKRLIGGGRVVSQEEFKKGKHPQQDSSIIEVPEPSEAMLRKHLKEIEHKIETYDGWNTDDTPHDAVDEMNAIKRKLQVFDNKRAAEQYKKEANNTGYSIVEGMKKGTIPQPLSKAKLLIKKKPLAGKPLGKK